MSAIRSTYILEVGGARLQLSRISTQKPRLDWSTNDGCSNLYVNLGGDMTGFEASSHSCLYPGSPTVGEFSWLPPGAAFTGAYGNGNIRFLEVSAPTSWPSPAWPRLAAFEPYVAEAARLIASRVSSGQTKGLLSAVLDLWTRLVRGQQTSDIRRGTGLSDPSFESVQRRVHSAPSRFRTATALAELTGAGLDGLNKSFQSRLGMSAAQYLDEARLRTARRLLCKGQAPLAQVALMAGYSSQSHLTDRMRDRYGITPARLKEVLKGWSAEPLMP